MSVAQTGEQPMQKISLAEARSATVFDPPPAKRTPPRPWLAAATFMGLAIIAFACTLILEFLLAENGPVALVVAVGVLGFGSSVVFAGWGIVRGVAPVFRAPAGSVGASALVVSSVLAVLGLLMMTVGALAALASTFGFSRGRQLRRHGRVLLPPVREGDAWADASKALETERGVPTGVARQWRENGRTEHASVASFARLTLDLMALGAPPALVVAANLDALDEIRHTEACFGLARAIDGQAESPGPFPEAQRAETLPRQRTLALATLAVTSLVDGALHEGVSARIIAKLARRCEEPSIASVLRQIAADEGRHAAHGWDVVAWCLEEGGSPVARALIGAARVLPRQMRSNLPEAARSGAWERFGIHGRALELEEYARTRAQVVSRVRVLTQALPARTTASAA